ncbi:hypothetical protein [Fibrobacter sp. UWB12]|uniref:hypothetical protein n=1 Tax=Fibrobacter sp. UWB12 TaxID=1896203 RepID=UPI0009163ABD|nr:hypothetical protein [Fibrobacter sp. UWB12]SHK20766.1 hypothetical protein SAMN05720759_101108 [Fibrobacter sp. UWB12]
MNNVIKFTMAAGLLALAACSDDSVSGAAIEPSTMANNSSSSDGANNSSSSVVSSSSISSSSSNVGEYFIEFTTKPTQVMALTHGEASVYGEEFGAEAQCSAGYRSYLARFNVDYAHMFVKSMMISGFDDACDSIYDKFKNSCASGIIVDSERHPEGACNKGRFKAFCYLSKTDSVTVCSNGQDCETKGPVAEVVFDSIVTDFLRESREACDNIAVGIDTTAMQHDLPSMPAVGIDTSANRSFIIKPNVETLNVSDDERAVLDSLAMAYPSKSVVSATNDLRIYSAAKYVFKTSPEKYNVRAAAPRCDVSVYSEEQGLMLNVDLSMENRLENTILSVSDSVILYMVSGGLNSPLYKEYAETLFRTECEATAGSFYNYPSSEMFQTLQNLAMACAVKNFSGITLEAILGQQANLCVNKWTLVPAVLD